MADIGLPETHPARMHGVTRVTVEKIERPYRQFGSVRVSYRYTAHFGNGTSEVIRKAATRRYENAFLYADGGRAGANAGSLAGHFSYGAASYERSGPIQTFRVEDAPEPGRYSEHAAKGDPSRIDPPAKG